MPSLLEAVFKDKPVIFQGIWGFVIGHCANLFEPNSSWVDFHFVFLSMLAKLAGQNIKYIL